MSLTLRTAGRAVLLVVCLAAAACQSLQALGRSQQSPTRLPAEEVQSEVMAFTDSYTAVMDQALERIAQVLPEERGVLHAARLRNVQNAIIIAAGPNPIGALLDMTVMVTLQRQIAEEYWIPERLGEAGQPLVDGLRLLETEIWLMADRALDEQQVEALRALIPEIRERFRGQVFVSSIRASDFASDRRTTVANLEGGGSLLALFQLDPLAGLSPAAQELAQSRLLAERAFFWAKRLPTILNWEMQDFVLNTLSEPETQQFLAATTQISESSRRLSVVVEAFAAQLPEERAAALDQMNELVTTQREAALHQMNELVSAEREAALDQAFEGVAAEREAILRTFEEEDVRLRGLLEDLRGTIEASTTLSASLTTTIESTERMVASFSRSPDATDPPAEPRPPAEPHPDRRPFDITDYAVTAEATTATAEELNRLIVSLTDLLASSAWTERNSEIAAATDRAQVGLEELIDRSYRRGLVLIGLLVVGGFVAAIAYRLLVVRLIAPRG